MVAVVECIVDCVVVGCCVSAEVLAESLPRDLSIAVVDRVQQVVVLARGCTQE